MSELIGLRPLRRLPEFTDAALMCNRPEVIIEGVVNLGQGDRPQIVVPEDVHPTSGAVPGRLGGVPAGEQRLGRFRGSGGFGGYGDLAPRARSRGVVGGHALCLALALAGCKHVSELQVASNASAATAAQTETHEVKSAGPEHIVMTVEEYEQLCPGPAASGTTPGKAVGLSGPPTLLRKTVTVTDRGPSLDDLRSLSSLQSKVNTALAVKEEKKSGPAGLLGLLGSLWPVVLIGGAVLAFVLLKPAWLGPAWRFVAGAAKAAFGKKAP